MILPRLHEFVGRLKNQRWCYKFLWVPFAGRSAWGHGNATMVEILIQRQNIQERNIWCTEDRRSRLTLLSKKWSMKTFCPQDDIQYKYFTLLLLSKFILRNTPKEKHYKAITLLLHVAPSVVFVTWSSCYSNRGRKSYQELFYRENATYKNEVKTQKVIFFCQWIILEMLRSTGDIFPKRIARER